MIKLRSIAAILLALSLANYGVLASASAHSHAHDGWHPVHVAEVGGNEESHGRADGVGHGRPVITKTVVSADFDQNESAPDHTETGFHTHSTPQFGPNDAIVSLAFAIASDRASPPDPQGVIQRHRDKPPFKPPRAFL